jgi:6-phosphofructokinase 1
MKTSRIGILSGGGDCAGINPAIKWVVKTALEERHNQERDICYEVIGIREGWRGLLELNTTPLNQEIVRTWDRYGGTALGTSRTNPCDPRNDQTGTVLANIKTLGLDALVAIGGDDTQSVANCLYREGINIVSIPKTIDRDLPETDYTLGFETALNVITEEIDRLRTTAGSHRRVFVVETMGRHAGWLALGGGESSGAFVILIPEFDFSMEKISDIVLEGRKAGIRYDIVIAAEGAKPEGGVEFTKEAGLDAFGHKKLGGIAEYLARELQQMTGIETRSVNLSHLQRGGAPCAYDRRMGRYFGIAAVDLLAMHNYGKMVCLKNGSITACPLADVVGHASLVNVGTHYDRERYNGRRTIL